MHSLRSAAVQYTNYGTGGAFELPTQSGTYIYIYICVCVRVCVRARARVCVCDWSCEKGSSKHI